MPAPSPGSPVQAARTSVAERAARIRFRRALSLMVMTLVVPGSAQLAAGGNRRVGLVALRTWVGMWLLVVVGAVAVAFDHGLALTLGSTPWFLLLLRLALLVGAVGWAFPFMDAWRLGQPLTLGLAHRRAAVGVNGVLCLSVAGALLFGAHVVGVQRDLMLTMFGSGQVTDAHHGRFNVLLLGGDSGAGRWGLRPDSLTVASIDEDTGRTVLVSLPRNMQNFPFAEGSVMAEQFPDGFDADYLNGVSTWAQDNTELFEGSEDPGVDATISAVEGITGLQINYWAMVNLQGFKDLVDAVGGIEICPKMAMKDPQANLDVKKGCQEADGKTALGYARSRKLYTGLGDIQRAQAQREVVSAVGAEVLSPWSVLNPLRYWNLNMAATRTVEFGKGMSPVRAGLWAMAMTQVNGENGLTCGVPISDLSVRWDSERAPRMFQAIIDDDTDRIGKQLCSPSGLAS